MVKCPQEIISKRWVEDTLCTLYGEWEWADSHCGNNHVILLCKSNVLRQHDSCHVFNSTWSAECAEFDSIVIELLINNFYQLQTITCILFKQHKLQQLFWMLKALKRSREGFVILGCPRLGQHLGRICTRRLEFKWCQFFSLKKMVWPYHCS